MNAASLISSLGYVGFRVSDIIAWSDYATGILGMMETEPSGTSRRFRVDHAAWRVAVDEGDENDIVFAGFEVPDESALNRLIARLDEHGVPVERADKALLRDRAVLGLAYATDPDGLRVEFYFGPTERFEIPFQSPAGVSGFVTGDQGLGHIVLGARDMKKAQAFWRDALGFRLSDIIAMAMSPEFTLNLEFYHCNPRHHTLALVPVPAPKRLHHFMLETRTLDDVGQALDRCNAGKHHVIQSIGRHSNDHMVSFYAVTPGGFQVEYGWGARDVDETTWRVVKHDKTSIWGHKFQSAPTA